MINNEHKKSTTVRSYVSAIKAVLMEDGIKISEDAYLLKSLTKACKLCNDRVRIRLPIHQGLLNILLKEIQKMFESNGQQYLNVLYQALFCSAYYGLLRVGEITKGSHPVLAPDVHIGQNKKKILFILRTSKTHWRDQKPQIVKITSTERKKEKINKEKLFCPFAIIREYANSRPDCVNNDEPFFVFRDRSPVTPLHLRTVLKESLKKGGFKAECYNVQSFRIGRAVDLNNLGTSVSDLKKLGRWSSNSVYTYLTYN